MKLYPHQTAGVKFLQEGTRRLLAFEMGLGKTATVLSALTEDRLPAVVVCPASVRNVWVEETGKFRPDLSVQAITTGKDPVDMDKDLTVVSYALFGKIRVPRPRTVVYDESHYLQSWKSKRAALAMYLAERNPETNFWFLTGTPLWSTPRSLFPLFRMAGEWPGDYFSFSVYFCGARHIWRGGARIWDDTGSSNIPEMKKRLSRFMLRRKTEEVFPDMPRLTRQIVRLDAPVSGGEKELDFDLDSLAGHIPPGPIATAIKDTGMAKIPDALKHIKDLLVEERKLVLFAWNRDAITELDLALSRYGVVTVHGGTKPVDKDRHIEEFQKDPRVRVFIGQTAAAGVGVTLTAARVAVFVQPDWTPAVLAQAEKRIHRIGQTRPVLIQYLLTRGSIEDEMVTRVIDKEDVNQEIVED